MTTDHRSILWETPGLSVRFATPEHGPVSVLAVRPAGSPAPEPVLPDAHGEQPLVELSAFGHGRFPGSYRHVDTVIGRELRFASETRTEDDGRHELRIAQVDVDRGIHVTSVFETYGSTAALRTWTEVTVATDLVIDAVSSFATGSFLADARADSVDALVLAHADNDWIAESRWRVERLRAAGLVDVLRQAHHHQPPRTRIALGNRGSWSSGEKVPVAAVAAADAGYALAWQIEHNGPWLAELGENGHGAYLLLSGPTDQEHQWSVRLRDGEMFVSTPVSVAVALGDATDALRALTDHRRAIRHPRAADDALPVVFNDYMNTLMGNPTTERLLPLVDAAAEAGADYFCIDAGWYADGHWWDGVGAWEPSTVRFPGGIAEVTEHIRSRGMVPGLWLEPEVIGVRSPLAESLPDDAFFQRHGVRIAEHGRHLLDLRHPAARAHLDAVVDRLVDDYGIGFIKMDENTMTGPGSDLGGVAPGHGHLEHARALLDWIDAVQARHPDLLIENCSSGAMRMDYALLSRLHLQSTSDQQDPVAYASIAAAAPAAILPEQAGNWAYPQTGMSTEARTFALVNGVLGRMYLSGYLNRMTPVEVDDVRAAVTAQKTVLAGIRDRHPVWPLGLPAWGADWVSLGLHDVTAAQAYVSVWRRAGDGTAALHLPWARGRELEVIPFFPTDAAGWTWTWDAEAGVLETTAPAAEPSARTFDIRAV
ncbi:glycoside hydrolase family 36 protein [Microbacterium sp. NPDC056234]|uniref:glycoside hydrolase family 36 protein n=1 Tax=Microbacterium sp. NPDC056234 TaxID=3345757 RepID=UPI0035DEE067